jgi:hypothetical protein
MHRKDQWQGLRRFPLSLVPHRVLILALGIPPWPILGLSEPACWSKPEPSHLGREHGLNSQLMSWAITQHEVSDVDTESSTMSSCEPEES